MEDVVLHYKPESGDGLKFLLEKTEKLLEPFPCRIPPTFSPWFPTLDSRLVIRPAKPAPIITSVEDFPKKYCAESQEAVGSPVTGKHKVLAETLLRSPKKTQDVFCIPETPNHLLPEETSPRKQLQLVRRSWSIFTRRRDPVQSSKTLSKRFHCMVSAHQLNLHQRAKWVISKHNCRDIEKAWCALSRSVRTSKLPTCNANIQRERAEIWVFCDVAYSEQVGSFLKEALQLSGRINLSVHRLGNIFNM